MSATLARWQRDSPVVRFPDERVDLTKMADCWTVLRDPKAVANGNGFEAVEIPAEERMLDAPDQIVAWTRELLGSRARDREVDHHLVVFGEAIADRESDVWNRGAKAQHRLLLPFAA